MAYFFFTETDKLSAQASNQAFGVVNENSYRLCNKFTATEDTKAYAMTSGSVMIQEAIENDDLVNLVLRVRDQPITPLPKIEFIIYHGLKKESFFTTNNIISDSSVSDLTRKIWESHTALEADSESTVESPTAQSILGFGYTVDGEDTLNAPHNKPLDFAFFNENHNLFSINAGDHIGDFNQNHIGITVIFEGIGYYPQFNLARTLEPSINFSALASDASVSDIFRRKHDKEEILNFFDLSSLYGSLSSEGINFFDQNHITIPFNGDGVYQNFLIKFYNKNKLYVDIRNNTNDSYNYYENYSSTIKIDLLNNDSFQDIIYYRNGWPILCLDPNDFGSNTSYNLQIGLPTGDNVNPRIYLKTGILDNQTVIGEKSTFLNFEYLEDGTDYLIFDKLGTFKNTNGDIISSYIQVKYISRYSKPNHNLSEKSIRNFSYLDTLFPIFNLNTPFVQSVDVDVKVLNHEFYVDKSDINETEYFGSIGIAKDAESIHLFHFPVEYHSVNDYENVQKIPLVTESSNDQNLSSFISYLNGKLTSGKVVKRFFESDPEEYTYYEMNSGDEFYDELIASGELDDSIGDSFGGTAVAENISVEAPRSGMKYDIDNINLISISNDEYLELEGLKSQFATPYKIYLGVAETNYLLENYNSASTTKLALKGLKETPEGKIVYHQAVSSIEVFTKEKLYNSKSLWGGVKVIDASFWSHDGDHIINLLPFGINDFKVKVFTEEAEGQEILVKLFAPTEHWDVDDSENHQLHYAKKYAIVPENNVTVIDFKADGAFFSQHFYDENIKEFVIHVSPTEAWKNVFSDGATSKLKIHAVRYVSDVLRAKNWTEGYKAQIDWFENQAASNKNLVQPRINLYDIDWMLPFLDVGYVYETLKNEGWKNIPTIKGEIRKMYTRNIFETGTPYLSLPTTNSPVQISAMDDDTISWITSNFNSNGEYAPIWENFYHKNEGYSLWDPIHVDNLPDLDPRAIYPPSHFTSAIASFNIRAVIGGNLEYIDGVDIKVTIDKLGIYSKDAFDFAEADDDDSILFDENDLGRWDLRNNVVRSIDWPFIGSPLFSFSNSDFRQYREDFSNKGQDHWRYSRIKKITLTGNDILTFNMPIIDPNPND